MTHDDRPLSQTMDEMLAAIANSNASFPSPDVFEAGTHLEAAETLVELASADLLPCPPGAVRRRFLARRIADEVLFTAVREFARLVVDLLGEGATTEVLAVIDTPGAIAWKGRCVRYDIVDKCWHALGKRKRLIKRLETAEVVPYLRRGR